MKKHRNATKLLCWLLSLMLLFCSLPVTIFAQGSSFSESDSSTRQETDNTSNNEESSKTINTQTQASTVSPFSMQGFVEMKEGDLTLEELKTKTVDLSSIPEFISAERALSKGHVNRVMAQEGNLGTIVYQNSDGTKSTYIFNTPVKYIDTDGTVKDKSTKLNSLTDSIYSYGMTQNLAKAYFANLSANGVMLEVGEYSVNMKPVSSVRANVTYVDENTVRYDGVYGAFTSLVYETKMSGVKEYVLLGKDIGVNEFAFVLSTVGLTPVEIGGIWYLQNAENVIIATLGAIEITDSAGHRTLGTMSITPSTQRDTYNVLITVPESFLNDPSTVYPVLVDPTTYIYEEGYYQTNQGQLTHYYNAITDTGLYTNSNAMMDVGPSYHIVGDLGSFQGKVIYRLYDFYGEYGQFTDLEANQIGKVTFYINVNSGIPTTFIINPMTSTWGSDPYGEYPAVIYGDSDLWSEYSTAISCSVETDLTNGGKYGIDITSLVRTWLRHNADVANTDYSNPAKGFVLSASSGTYRFVDAVEESHSDSVYYAIDTSPTYGDHYINNQATGKFLKKNGTNLLTTSLYEDSDLIRWRFEYLGNDLYYIRSVADSNYYLRGSGSNVSLALLAGNDKSAYQWKIVDHCTLMNDDSDLVLCFNGTSLSMVSERAETHANYAQTQWSLVSTETNVDLTDFDLHDTFLLPSQPKTFYVEADTFWNDNNHFTWTIVSNAGGNNTFSVDQNGTVTASQYGGTATLTVTHKPTGCTKVFTIKSGAIREGEYMLMNKGTSRYADVKGPSLNAGVLIHQWEYHTGQQIKWQLEIQANGSYTIKSVYSNLYLALDNRMGANEILQDSLDSPLPTTWRVSQTASGNYRISPSNDSSKALAVPSGVNENGTNLTAVVHNGNGNDRIEWIFDSVGQTFGITSGEIYMIKAKHSDKVLTAENGVEENGTNVSQHTLTAGYQWQRWKIEYIGNGEYKIYDMNSGKLLSVDTTANFNGANVRLWADEGTSGQVFKIVENDDGSYSFFAKTGGRVYSLSVSNGGLGEDVNVCQALYQGLDSQKFTVQRYPARIDFILPCIAEIYDYAKQYAPDMGYQYWEYLTLQYIRHNHPDYNGELWKITAGVIDQAFINYVDARNTMLSRIFNGDTNPNPTHADNSAASYILDANDEYVDFYHMCATLNGMVYSDVVYQTVIDEEVKNLAGWAGDLITTIPNVFTRLEALGQTKNYQNTYDAMYYIMSAGGQDSAFSRQDFLADIDAIVMFTILQNVSMEGYEEYFYYYYVYNCKYRFSCIATMLSYEESVETVDFYLSSDLFVVLLLQEELIELTDDQRCGIRDAFVNYFWECVENE